MTSYVAQAHPHPNPNPRYSKNASSLSPIGTEINGAFQNRFSTDPMANGFSAIGSFKERIRKLHDSEDDKNQLIEDLFNRLFDVESKYRQSLLDHDREKRYNRDGQLREREYQTRLNQLQGLMDISPFVLVLLDGDCMLFEDQYVRCGEPGGKEAANQLDAFIREYVQSELPLHTASKVMIKIYANLKGLAQAYYRSGIIDKPSVFEDFARGFNESRLLNDFIDIGIGKDRIDGKIVGHFNLFIDNSHCHQIFLGINHEDSYAQLLEKVQTDPSKCSNITLLEGLPFEEDLAAVVENSVFHSQTFPGLFRATKLPINTTWVTSQLHTVGPTLPPTSPLARISSNTSTSTTGSSSNTPSHRMSFASVAASQAAEHPILSPNLTPSPTFSATSPTPTSTPATTSVPSTTIIKRNRAGQRIDPIDRTIPNHDVQRIKKLKLCNIFYLLGSCHNADCAHDHSKPLSAYERRVLGIVARMTPCHARTECENPRCIYGHRCPQNEPGRGDCYYRENCHFWGWGHGIDESVVGGGGGGGMPGTVVVGGRGKV